MSKRVNDLDIRNMDLNPYMIVIPAGLSFYRVVEQGQEPRIPTGSASRFVSQPSHYTNSIDFGRLYTQGKHISTGTASTCVTYEWSVAYAESPATNKELYKLTLNKSIDAVDVDLICAAEGISKPYMTANHDGSWQEFYGKKVQAVRYESFKCKTQYCLNLFPDWIPNFKSLFNIEKITIPNADERT